MATQIMAEDQSRRVETIGGNPIAVSSYRLGSTYYAKAEIDVPGAGARIAQAEDSTREAAESKVLADVRRIIEKKG